MELCLLCSGLVEYVPTRVHRCNMSGIKVYLHFECDPAPHKTSKIAVPKSWMTKSVKDVIGLFAKAYNDKNLPEHAIDIDAVHLQTADGSKVHSDASVDLTLGDNSDYYIKPGKHLQKKEASEASDALAGKLRCRNYGCNQFFDPADNSDSSCRFHVSPPIFHDTMKCWSCCRDKKAYDFESFQLIAGCSTGPHSTEAPAGALISASPNAPSAGTSAGPPQPLKSIAEYNAANPTAVTAAASAAQTIFAPRKSSRSPDGLTAKCQRKGCQKSFNLSDNNDCACSFHEGQPVFHDAVKFWSCCSDKKCYDFDQFLAVKGCKTGHHDDGVIPL